MNTRRASVLGPEPRVARTVSRFGEGWHSKALWRVVLPQVLVLWTATFTAQWGIVHGYPLPMSLLDIVGVALVCAGLSLEGYAEARLLAFRENGDGSGVLDEGVWGWSRHPNQLGTVVASWGMWLIVASAGEGLLGLVSPVLVTLALARVFGGAASEQGRESRRPQYAAYQRTVSAFVPMPVPAVTEGELPTGALDLAASPAPEPAKV